MHVIKVLPFSKSPALQLLSYFSKHSYKPGQVITIPVRKQLLTGMVIECTLVAKMKSDIRKSHFKLKKIPEQTNVIAQIPQPIIDTAETLASLYPSTLSTILSQLIPKEIRENTIPTPHTTCKTSSKEEYVTLNVPYIIHDTFSNRLIHYQNIIRSSFANNQSVVLVVPLVNMIEDIYNHLTAGIKQKTFLLHRNIAPKKRQLVLETYFENKDFVLLLTTPTYAYFTKPNTKTIILDEAASTYYTSRNRPFVNHLKGLELHAKNIEADCYLGDTLPSCHQEMLRREDKMQSFNETPKRIILNTSIQTIVIKEPESKNNTFHIFAEETLLRIKNSIQAGKNTFVFAGRKGLAPLIMCYDCGNIIRNQETGNPYSLIRTFKKDIEYRWFIDNVSGQKIRAFDTCTACGSWRLRERGIGIQQVHNVLKEFFPETNSIIFDGEVTQSKKNTQRTLGEIQKMRGGIVLGTIAYIPYINNIHLTCISSYEAFISIPAWRADEINLRLLLQLREKTKEQIIMQTRSDISPILTLANKGLVERFYNEEIDLREQCDYPPFSTLIHFSWSGSLAEVRATEHYLDSILSDYPITYYSNPYSTNTHHFRFGLIKLPSHHWPDQELKEKIIGLPYKITVRINPEKII